MEIPGQNSSGNQRQHGAAILIVLLITAIASVVALGISERLALDLARTETMLLGIRGNELSSGLEALAGRLLREDNKDEPDYDHAGSLWARPLPGFPVPGGLVTGSMQSLDGRFNLNSLLERNSPQNSPQKDTFAYDQCKRLLKALNLPETIADALLDWQDGDTIERSGGGAEDGYYRQLNPPYAAANQPFIHISELRLVAGITPQIYQRLVPHVTVLPASARSINVNLASIPVLQSLDDSITSQRAAELYQQGQALHMDVDAFLDKALQGLGGQVRADLRNRVTVRSDYFLAQADVLLGDRPQRYYALLERRNDQYHVHYRSFASP